MSDLTTIQITSDYQDDTTGTKLVNGTTLNADVAALADGHNNVKRVLDYLLTGTNTLKTASIREQMLHPELLAYFQTPRPYGSGNYVFATPDGAPGVPVLRALVKADLPTLTAADVGAIDNATLVTTVASAVSHAIRTPSGDSANMELPDQANRVGKVVTFGPNGETLLVPATSGGIPASLVNGPGSVIIDASGNITMSGSGMTLTPASGVATVAGSLKTANLTGKNFLHNPAFLVNQRGTVQAIVAGANILYPADRFQFVTNAGNAVVGSVDALTLNSFSGIGVVPGIKVTVNTAQASMAAGDAVFLRQSLEGRDVARLVGETFTVSLRIYAAVAGTYGVSIKTNGTVQSYVTVHSLSVGWNSVSFTVAGGLPSGSILVDASSQLELRICGACGSNYQTASTNTWVAGTYLSTSAQTNALAATGARFAIATPQLELGGVATPFEVRPYAQELAICRLYFVRIAAGSATGVLAVGPVNSTTTGYVTLPLPVPMRATPSASLYALGELNDPGVAWYAVTALATSAPTPFSAQLALTIGTASLVVGRATSWRGGAVDLSAEI